MTGFWGRDDGTLCCGLGDGCGFGDCRNFGDGQAPGGGSVTLLFSLLLERRDCRFFSS